MPGATLALRQLRLSHFRSHLRVDLALDGRPVALFGANGAGKTNILEAISLLSPGRGLRRAAAADLARQPQALGWSVAGLLDSRGQTHELALRAEAGQPRSVAIDGKAVPQVALGRIARILWLVPAMDRLWTESAEGRRRFLDRMTLSFLPDHAEVALDYEKAMRQRNRLLKDGQRNASWYDALEAQMARTGAVLQDNRQHALDRIATASQDAATAFPRAVLRVQMPDDLPPHPDEAELTRLLAGGRSRDMAAGRTLAGPHRADLDAVFQAKGVAARQASTGEQKALLISVVLANARALAQDFGAPPILLLDEVAAHLDNARRAALYDEICALGAQAWMTGTGAELFDTLGPRAQAFEIAETPQGSTAKECTR
ncbi:DNA replication/repair protein RecF [Brevirhabdus sp.]|uniref:DNA replication/repair protein RecF n=1 Tax=Brevirhabdus sp. TaxID=2004514 RepID=UPI00405A01BE